MSATRQAAPRRVAAASSVILDLGCGTKKLPSSLGVDLRPTPAVDVLADLRWGLPFRDSSVDAVHVSHLLEHLPDLVATMGEIWRVGKPGAVVHIRGPHGSSQVATWRDPTHLRELLVSTFTYFDDHFLEGRLCSFYVRPRFRLERARLDYSIDRGRGLRKTGRARRVLGTVLETIANRSLHSQLFAERTWAPWVGFEEFHVWLRLLKEG